MTTQSKKPRLSAAQTGPDPVAPEPFGPIVLKLNPLLRLTDEQLAELCSLNDALRIERNAQGDLEFMPPTHPTSGNRNSRITARLDNWAEGDGTGAAFDATAGFTLPNGALRSPDAAWILKSRLAGMTEEDRRGFWRISPDFVIELRSPSDRLRGLHAKMDEYMENGVRLGWLIDPLDPRRRVYVYRPGVPVEILEGPATLSGEPELPGFILDLQPIWEPAF